MKSGMTVCEAQGDSGGSGVTNHSVIPANAVNQAKRVPEKLLPSAKPLLKAFFSMLP